MRKLAPDVKSNLEAGAQRKLATVLHEHDDCPVLVWFTKFSKVGLSPKLLGRLLAGRLTARDQKQAKLEAESKPAPSPWSDKDY